jgi:hypothetical protein
MLNLKSPENGAVEEPGGFYTDFEVCKPNLQAILGLILRPFEPTISPLKQGPWPHQLVIT